MSQQKDAMPETAQPRSAPAKNPYIMNFCKVLVEKKAGRAAAGGAEKNSSETCTAFSSACSDRT